MEHYRRNEKNEVVLSGGWFCLKCGKRTSMMGHTDCQPNASLVAELVELNK